MSYEAWGEPDGRPRPKPPAAPKSLPAPGLKFCGKCLRYRSPEGGKGIGARYRCAHCHSLRIKPLVRP